jgi:rSAM/selenodomain-associated transferase 2
MQKYSIIIPSLNEDKFLPHVLTHLRKFTEEIEIILSDGGSTDNTIKIAEKLGVKVYSGKKGKGVQMNRAAESSNGEVLIFLHADTFLPDDAFYLINKFFFTHKTDIATFKMKFDSENILMKIYSWFTKFDSIFTTFGDQVIVVRRSFFNELGRFPNLPIFEDVEFFRKARKSKTIYKLPSFVTTSARRFTKKGILKTQLLNGIYILGYLVGVNPNKIYRKYFKDSSF